MNLVSEGLRRSGGIGIATALLLIVLGHITVAAVVLFLVLLLRGLDILRASRTTSPPSPRPIDTTKVASMSPLSSRTTIPVEIPAVSGVLPAATPLPTDTQTAPLRSDDNLLKANERLRIAMESARDGVLILDEVGNLVDCNPAAERLLGIERERFLGKQFVATLSEMMESNEVSGFGYTLEELSELARPLRIQQARITRRQFTSTVTTNTGIQKLIIEEIGSPVYANNGKVIGRMLVLRDMSEHEALIEFRDQVTHMVVHDLRGPLTAILNGIDLALQTDNPLSETEIRRILRLCLDSGGSLMRQIEGLLDIAHIENNTLPIRPQTVSAAEIVDTAYQSLANTFTEMRIALETHLPDDLPPLMVDPDIMRRVFINLLDNALRFTLRDTRVRVDAEVSPTDYGFVLISVSDNGPGIPKDQRENVFEAYRRLPHSGPPGGRRGFGLGLTFCKLAVDAHGGKISIEDASEGMTGSRFVVRLPVSR